MVSEPTPKKNNLYETDYNLWVSETVRKLENQEFSTLDLENLIEEVGNLGREQRHKVESYLRQLLKHLLLYHFWDEKKVYCQTGWAEEIDNFRAELEILLCSKTLHNYCNSILESTLVPNEFVLKG